MAAGTLWLALDGNHYWHDIRFMYACTQFSIKELLLGHFNPHQLGGDIDEVSTGGFYFAKILHIYLLKSLFKWVPPADGGMNISVLLSLSCMGFSALMSYKILLRLLKNKHLAVLALLSFLLMPVTPYLGGKLLSEVTALLLVMISILAMVSAIEYQEARGVYFSACSGVFLLLAGLARLDIVVSFFGLWGALLLNPEKKGDRKKLLKAGGIASIIFTAGYLVAIYLSGTEVNALVQYYKSFVGADAKSGIMSVLGILTFGGIIYVFAIIAIFSHEREKVHFFVTWAFLTAVPVIVITKNYMVEPRYLSPAILPLAGLGALGMDVLWQKTQKMSRSAIWTGVSIIMIITINSAFVRMMPYELNRPSLLKAVDQIIEKDNEAVILVPWAYTDFHFLHVMLPEQQIYNVQSLPDEKEKGNLFYAWQNRLEKWYGDGYINSSEQLEIIMAERPVFYLGWRKYPPAENAKKLTNILGLERLTSIIDSFPLKDHLAQSWMWNSNRYLFEPDGESGQYRYYRVWRKHI